jgi:ribose transport system ATP-binding protein
VIGATSAMEGARGNVVHPPSLVVRNLSKTFGLGLPALDGVSFEVQAGEIHGLVGQNGSGKSTLIKILSGYHRPDRGGEVVVAGKQVETGLPAAARAAGCRFVHQDLALVESLSVADNLSLTDGYPSTFGTIRRSRLRADARRELERIGLDVRPQALVSTLPPALKTGVALARALLGAQQSRVNLLVLDEPTATLPDAEVHQLLDMVRRVAADGIGVLFVTHRLDEIAELSDVVTVLRDGRKIATEESGAVDTMSLVRMMTGDELADLADSAPTGSTATPKQCLSVSNLVAPELRNVSVEVHAGEIVGVAGLVGSGRETVLSAIFGAVDRAHGVVTVDGVAVARHRPDQALAAGMAYLPSDRLSKAGLMTLTARENLTISDLRPFWRWPAMRRGVERREVSMWFDELQIRPTYGAELNLSALSGGNQQKVVLARLLRRRPRVLLLDEPTQGVDVVAKAGIHQQLLRAAEAGAAVMVSSSDLDELVAISHRVLVFRRGMVAAEIRAHELTAGRLSAESLGAATVEPS